MAATKQFRIQQIRGQGKTVPYRAYYIKVTVHVVPIYGELGGRRGGGGHLNTSDKPNAAMGDNPRSKLILNGRSTDRRWE